jgi:hypothetical protein
VTPQLQAIVDELEDAECRVLSMAANLPVEQWTCRPGRGRWSAAECVEHLNISSEALLPLLRSALDAAGGKLQSAPRYRRDPIGWLIWKLVGESGGLKARTSQAFEPKGASTPQELVARFTRQQAELRACVLAAEGLPIDRVKMVSPFDRRVSYNLYAALTLVPRHQHRHLLQAEQAARTAADADSSAGVLSRA